MAHTRRQFLAGSATTITAVLASLAVLQRGVNAVSDTKKPNVVLLFADDAGYGDLGCYGHPTIKTPNLDRIAAEGARFTSFYVPPSCTPSRAALLTGRYPIRLGAVMRVLGPDSPGGLSSEEITIASALQNVGYRTKCVGKWHLGHAEPEFQPTAHGFDSYFGLLYSNDMIPPWVETEKPLELYRDTEPIELVEDQSLITTRYTEESVNFIHENADNPFFLYLAYAMPHLPLAADRFRGKSRADFYGDVIEELDWSAGEVLKALDAAGVADNTLVIWLSDNGPWINMPPRMVQGGNEPWHAGSPGPFRGAKGTTYEGGQRVPAIAWLPGKIPPGRVIRDQANSLDIFPTIAGICGADVPDDRVMDGNDLWHLITGVTDQTPSDLYFYIGNEFLQAVRKGPWKLRIAEGNIELFHLERDIAELFNVAENHPDIVKELHQLLVAFAEETGAVLDDVTV